MAEQNDYLYVRAWGKLLGSFHYYIREQVEQARADGAPANATHRKVDGTWATTDDITRAETRRQLGLEPLPPQAPDLAHITSLMRNILQRDDELADRYGLADVSATSDGILIISFITGWTARVTIELLMPTEPS